MLPTLAGVEPATSWSPVGRCIQLSHRGRQIFPLMSTLKQRVGKTGIMLHLTVGEMGVGERE